MCSMQCLIEWVPIAGYEKSYSVNNIGQVKAESRNVRRLGRDGKFHYVHRDEKILTPKNRGLYLCVLLSKEGVRTAHSIHRLVAEAFIPNPDRLPQVNHKDEDKHNNTRDNLEWCTNEYNQRYSRGIPLSLCKGGERYDFESRAEARVQMGVCGASLWRLTSGRSSEIRGWRLYE